MLESEGPDQLIVIIIDETYGSSDDDTWEEASEAYRLGLESEFGVHFREANVGPGADIPAFITTILTTSVPLWSVLLAAFFLGKPINENIEAWSAIGRRVRSFFGRPVILARQGASVLAVEAVFEELGGIPKSVRLLSYQPAHIADSDDLAKMASSDVIHDNVPTLNLGYVRHIFEIEADGRQFRVSVDGKRTKIITI